MKYDFTSILDRRGKDAVAVDAVGAPGSSYPAPREGFDVIPMWVADMNFPVVPTVQQAMIARAEHPAFGYFDPPAEYYDSIIRWQEDHNGVTGLKPEHIGYENGVLGGVISALNVLCSKGDNVLLHSPTYIGFTHCLTDNGYHIVHSPLTKDEQGVWRMDFADMEKKIVENHIHAAIFCSPHNPCGRVWERREVEQAMALYAPSKTFNLAGLVGSYHIIYNSWLRDRCDKEGSLSHYNAMNVMSMHALLGAYKPEGCEWVEELRQVITGNVDFACDYIAQHFNGVEVSRPQGTYMLFLDCEKWLTAHGKTMDELLAAGWDVGVVWQDGRAFHGQTHIRMNLALPLSRVQEAFRRLDTYVFNA